MQMEPKRENYPHNYFQTDLQAMIVLNALLAEYHLEFVISFLIKL